MTRPPRRCASLTFCALLCAAPVVAQDPDPPEKELVNARFPVLVEAWVPCAANGEGETVTVAGQLHTVVSGRTNGNNVVFLRTHVNPQGTSGTGARTGTIYQGVGVTSFSYTLDPSSTTADFTFVNNFHFVGAGPGNDLMIKHQVHIVVGPEGEISVSIDRLTVTCK